MLKINSFVAIKILLQCDCLHKDWGCLHTTPFMGNFDSICVFLCFYMDMNCFRLVRHVVSSWFRVGSVAADGVGGLGGWLQMVLGSCLWFQLVSGGFGWFRVVCCFSSYACWILFLKRLKACNFIKNRFQQQGVFIRNLQNF